MSVSEDFWAQYESTCIQCGVKSEPMMLIGDDLHYVCPECGAWWSEKKEDNNEV